jgi:hypothetical protein
MRSRSLPRKFWLLFAEGFRKRCGRDSHANDSRGDQRRSSTHRTLLDDRRPAGYTYLTTIGHNRSFAKSLGKSLFRGNRK